MVDFPSSNLHMGNLPVPYLIRAIRQTRRHCRRLRNILRWSCESSWLLQMRNRKSMSKHIGCLKPYIRYLICWKITSRIKSQFFQLKSDLFCRRPITNAMTLNNWNHWLKLMPTKKYILKTNLILKNKSGFGTTGFSKNKNYKKH